MIDNPINGRAPTPASTTSPREPLALIGIGCRFPGGANDPISFWKLLEEGRDAVAEVPAERWNQKTFYDSELGKPGKSHANRGGFLEGIDRFDPRFFGISPREAAHVDPQQRLLLETAWEALEDGGQVLERISGSKASVFVGISSWEYSFAQISFRDRGLIDAYTNTGGSLSIAANRISYCFDLRGPSVAVDTACSSALVAVHLACKSIWEEGCSLALAGGVNVLLLPDWYVGFSRLGMLSPDGRCHAFDAAANGFVRGEGAGFLVLKPLSRAQADGDRIYAVVRGTAVNQDGRTPGLTVPSEVAQESLLRQAYHNAGISPAQVHYIEAHGTGTLVGDPIEARSLSRVLSVERPPDRPCLIGSVKTNLGHLEAGSGIAGVIKTALALHHRRIPGNLHFLRPNPAIDFDRLRLRVPVDCQPWPATDGPATAGVNSFGYGGTNAHVVMQEAPPRSANGRRQPAGNGMNQPAGKGMNQPADAGRTPVLLPLSARDPQALRALAGAWEQFLKTCPEDITPHDLAHNAALRRSHHEHRLAILAHSRKELTENLAAFAAGQTPPSASTDRVASAPHLAFVCSGQGPQWWAMGRQLLDQEPVFRAAIECCDEIVRQLGSWSLLEELTADEKRSRMAVTAISQPAIFALQVALAALWRSWGVEPAAVIGHSVGEVAAAHLAGVFDLEDALRVIYQRGRCMELAPSRGRMLAAGISAEEARRLLHPYGERVSLAAVNSAASVTLSGEAGPLEEIARGLEERRVFCRFLQVHYAFHSAQMDPVRDELLASLCGLPPRPASLPLFSTVSGRRIDGPEMGPDYWWRNVRQTVRFADGVDHLIHLGCDTVVELSPHPVLIASVAECYRQHGKKVHVLPSLRRREEERATMLHSLGRLYVLGHPIDWASVTPGPARAIRLPLYPWQRERFWSESEDSRWSRLAAPAHPLLGTSLASPQPAWEARLDLRLTPYLNDHRVRNAILLPATAYVEMALAAARELFGDNPCRLEDVKLTNPCFLTPDRPMRMHTVFHSDESMLRIHSRTIDGEKDWTAHGSAIVRPQPTADRCREPSGTSSPARLAAPTESAAHTFSPEAIQQRCPQPFTHEECYACFQKIGLDYGPMFRGIERGWRGECESLTVVSLPEEVAAAEDYLLHPALLDACFQGVLPASKDFNELISSFYIPVEIDAVHFHRRAGRRVWCHARLRETTPRWLVADLDIHDENGRLSAKVRGLRCQCVAGAGTEEKFDDLLYAYQWQARPLAVAERGHEVGAWLIFADRGGGIGEQLAERLRAAGNSCTLVFAGNSFSHPGEGVYKIHPGSAEDMARLLREVTASGFVHLWNLDAPPADGLNVAALEAAQEAGLLSILHLVQACEKTNGERTASVFLVTRGAQSVGDKPEPLAVAQSPVLGLGRVIVNECSHLRCKLIDLDPATNDTDTALLFAELTGADEEDEIAHRGGERLAHRFVSSTGEVANTAKDVPYRLMMDRPGDLDDLTPREVRRQPPGPGQVEIEVVAAGLNFSDVMKALGIYPGLSDSVVPLGAECSGHVSAVGEGVVDLRVGDEVLAVAPFAFGSHVTTRAELTARKPSRFTFEEAATLPLAFLTASYALDYLGRLSAGERVLIHSATGGVGLAAIQCARRVGAEVFATAGTPEKREYLKKLGIEHVMDSRSLAFAEEVMERTDGRGVDVVLNSLAGEALVRSLDVLADYGRFLEIGKRDVYGNTRLGLRPFRKNLSFFAIDLDRLMRERPALLGTLLRRIAQEAREGKLAPLPHRVFPITDAIGAFRFMQQSKHLGKIVLSMRERPAAVAPSEEPFAFRADATYLITGGLGGFGLAAARWMVERGARHLALLGRRGIHSPQARQAVAELESLGARIVVHRADVANEADVAAALAEIEHGGPPLRGVMHAAMVLEDGLLLNLNGERLRRVLAPKVNGAWNLHRQTLDRPLDFFVLFSSVASVFGHAGQGNYAAANAFLDGLAWHRRAQGLPALAVNWGYLAEVGYLAERPPLGERLERQGVLSFTVRQALVLLERAMQRRAIQLSVVRVDWSRCRALGVTGRVSPRFAPLLEQHARAESPREQRGLPTFDALRTADPDERRELVDVLLRDKLSRVLGTSTDRLEGDKPLLSLGVDSLMAVELRNWIEQELRVNLPIVELMRSPGLASLTDLLLGLFVHEDGVSRTSPARTEPHNGHAPSLAAAKPEELLAKLDELPSEEVDALLAALLNDKHRDRSTTR